MEFESYLHPEFLKLIEILNHKGFKIGVVGGTVRDFFLGVPNKHDYDCEIRMTDLSLDIEKEWEKLVVDSEYEVEELAFKIIKIKHSEFECELSMPRAEIFSDEFSHSNFDVIFNQSMNYEASAKRRDFTINSMMYEFNGHWMFIDPFKGKEDLKSKILKPCSFDFYLDPVRFLRAVRFNILLGFEIDSYLKSKFSEKIIESCSAHYFRMEGIKCKKPVKFWYELNNLCGKKIEDQNIEKFIGQEKFDGNLKDHLKGLVFLSADLQTNLQSFFDFSYKIISFKFPMEFKKIKRLNQVEFKKIFEKERLGIIVQGLKTLSEEQFSYLTSNCLVDLSYIELQKIFTMKMDLSEIPQQDRAWSLLFKQIQEIHD